jgi:hypothetical protein
MGFGGFRVGFTKLLIRGCAHRGLAVRALSSACRLRLHHALPFSGVFPFHGTEPFRIMLSNWLLYRNFGLKALRTYG